MRLFIYQILKKIMLNRVMQFFWRFGTKYLKVIFVHSIEFHSIERIVMGIEGVAKSLLH